MRAGRLSFTTNTAGERRIDVAELKRVFPLRGATAASMQRNDSQPAESVPAQQVIEHQAATIAKLHATIRDLRARLDASEAQRRQLIALLGPPAKRSWWRRWLR
jgi:hypothetical protein